MSKYVMSVVQKAYRPELEGSLALPQNEFGLDVIAYIGSLI